MAEEVSGRALREAALSPSATEPVPVSSLSGDDQPRDANTCMDCGGHNPVWFAPNDIWNLVIGGPEAKDDPGGFYCPVCSIARAEEAGIVPSAWELKPEAVR